MKCSCGTENPDVAQFCFTCGNRLTALATAPRESAGLRVRAPEGTRDDGLASPTAQLDTARSLAAPMSSTDHALKAVGTAETAPFEPSPLGRDTLPEAAVGANVSDTLIDMPGLHELHARLQAHAAAQRSGATSEASTTRPDDAEPAWAEAGLPAPPQSSAHPPSLKSARQKFPPTTHVASSPDSGARPPKVAERADWEKSLTDGDPASSSLFDYELRQVRRVQWTHRLLLLLVIAFLAGAAYFTYQGVSAMGRAALDPTSTPPPRMLAAAPHATAHHSALRVFATPPSRPSA